MKFLYYLAAIGNPNMDIKIDILKHNLISIFNNINQNFDIIINNYEENIDFFQIIDSFNYNFIENIFIHTQKGILCELWLTNNHHLKINNYDYIFFILDDVKILNIDVQKLISIKLTYDIEFLSPKVLKATWQYMKHPKYHNLMITNRVEIFCLLLKPIDFNKLMDLCDIENPNLWGLDYIISHFNIKTGVYHNCITEHYLESKSNHIEAHKQMIKYLKKYGYSSDNEIINKYSDVIIKIIE